HRQVDRTATGATAGVVIAKAADVAGARPVIGQRREQLRDQRLELLALTCGEQRNSVRGGRTTGGEHLIGEAAAAFRQFDRDRAAVSFRRASLPLREAVRLKPIDEPDGGRVAQPEDPSQPLDLEWA